jgi:hypothetical protein
MKKFSTALYRSRTDKKFSTSLNKSRSRTKISEEEEEKEKLYYERKGSSPGCDKFWIDLHWMHNDKSRSSRFPVTYWLPDLTDLNAIDRKDQITTLFQKFLAFVKDLVPNFSSDSTFFSPYEVSEVYLDFFFQRKIFFTYHLIEEIFVANLRIG